MNKKTEYYITNGDIIQEGHRKGYQSYFGQRTRGANSDKPYLVLATAERNARRMTNSVAKKHAEIKARGVTPTWELKPYYVATFKNGKLVPVQDEIIITKSGRAVFAAPDDETLVDQMGQPSR